MLARRIAIVTLGLFCWILAGCGEQTGPTDEDIAAILGEDFAVQDRLFIDLGVQIQWVSPNPGGGWGIDAAGLQSLDSFPTRIVIQLEPKEISGQAFEDALTNLTVSNLTFGETDTGGRYARTSSETIIYRNFEDFVVTFILTDFSTESIDPQYITEWERIALEGELNILE